MKPFVYPGSVATYWTIKLGSAGVMDFVKQQNKPGFSHWLWTKMTHHEILKLLNPTADAAPAVCVQVGTCVDPAEISREV